MDKRHSIRRHVLVTLMEVTASASPGDKCASFQARKALEADGDSLISRRL
jgi:hypothetical protein